MIRHRSSAAPEGVRKGWSTDPPPECPTLGAFIAWVRLRHSLSQRALGDVVDRSADVIGLYERGWRKPPPIIILDMLDGLPMADVAFNDVASWYSYRLVESLDPWSYDSIHAYVAGVRVYRGYSRVEFAAKLGCDPDRLRAVEHREKPAEEFLHRLVNRHLGPDFTYEHLRARFRTLRPNPDDQRRRGMFAELRRVEHGSPRYRALREQLIVDHLELARQIGLRVRHHRVPSPEAVQLASEALIRAVDGCDPRFGDFEPYLRKWVRGSIYQFARRAWVPGTATAVGAHGGAVARFVNEFGSEQGRDPTVEEVQAKLGLPRAVIQQALRARAARTTMSLDERHPDSGLAISDTLADGRSPHPAESADSIPVRELLDRLNPDQREVVALRYLDDLAVPDIAARTGRADPAIEDLLRGALDLLRAALRQGPRTALALHGESVPFRMPALG